MRVLIVTPEYPPDFGGGIGSFYGALVPALEETGCEVSVLRGSAFVHASASATSVADSDVSTLHEEQFNAWMERFVHLGVFPQLRRHLAAAFALHEQVDGGKGFDIVEVTDWGFLFLPWMLTTGTRVLVQLHGSCGQISQSESAPGREGENLLNGLLEKVALPIAGTLCTYSHSNATYWEQLLARQIQYQPPPLISRSSPQPASGEGWLTAGRIQKWKGPEVVCAAWQLLGPKAPPLRWFGRDTDDGLACGSFDRTLRARFPKVWGSRVRPESVVTTDALFKHMRSAKAVLIASTWDVFNLVAAEAMSLGKPLVISDGAGASELVDNGVNGFVFRSGDAQALAGAVRQVEAMTETELGRMGQAAAETIAERLNPSRIASQRIELYRNTQPVQSNPTAEWLRDLLLVNTQASDGLRFLDNLPLKELSRYVAERGLAKLSRSSR